MRGLFISNLFPSAAKPNCGTFSAKQLQACAADVDFKILVPTPWMDYRRSERDLWRSNNNLDATFFPYFYTPGVLRATYGARIHAAAKKLYPQIREFAPDFVLGSFIYPDGYAAMRIADDLGLPLALQALGSDIKVHGLNASRRSKICEALAFADKIFSVSKDLAEDMLRFDADPKSIVVNYNGVDQESFGVLDRQHCREKIGIKNRAGKTILFVGNLIRTKGVFELLEAIAGLHADGHKVQLLIVGTGKAETELRARITAAKLSHCVRLAGYVPNADLATWYSAADLFCLPSYSEGVPNVVMEAIACGTPVVASNVGGIPEIVNDDNGLLCTPRSSTSLIAALRSALDRRWDRELVSKTVSAFTWARYGERLVEHLRLLVDKQQT